MSRKPPYYNLDIGAQCIAHQTSLIYVSRGDAFCAFRLLLDSGILLSGVLFAINLSVIYVRCYLALLRRLARCPPVQRSRVLLRFATPGEYKRARRQFRHCSMTVQRPA